MPEIIIHDIKVFVLWSLASPDFLAKLVAVRCCKGHDDSETKLHKERIRGVIIFVSNHMIFKGCISTTYFILLQFVTTKGLGGCNLVELYVKNVPIAFSYHANYFDMTLLI